MPWESTGSKNVVSRLEYSTSDAGFSYALIPLIMAISPLPVKCRGAMTTVS